MYDTSPRRPARSQDLVARLAALTRRSEARNFMVVSVSSVAGVAASFLRGVILAHILTPREFGLGVILITVTAALDMFADAGLDKFVVQNRFGFREDVLRTAHCFRVVGSLGVSLAIVVLAYPLALLFHAPTVFPAIAATGGVVALRGFIDLRYKLQQREHRFEAEARIEIARSSLEIIVLLIAGLVLRSYWCVIIAAYVNAIVQVLMSYRYDTQPYRLMARKRLLRLVARFSTPIYINAAILFAAIQGDRMVVATLFDKTELAFYTVACAISQGLMVVLNRVTMNILLPRIARRAVSTRSDHDEINRLGVLVIALSIAFLIGMTLLGPAATRIIYGSRYHGLTAIIYASSIVNMIQIEQVWVTTVLMAYAKTSRFPVITIMRASAVPISIVFAEVGASLLAIPLGFAVGAALSLAVGYAVAAPLKLIKRSTIVLSFCRIGLAILATPVLATLFPVGHFA